MSAASKFTAVAFGLSAASGVAQSLLGRKSTQFGLGDMSMPALTATLALATKPGRTRNAATIALLASTAGDMSGTLPFKIGWFGAAHVAYITAFCKGGRRRWWPVLPIIVGAGVWASAKSGGLRPACALYASLVAVMALTASSYSRLAGASALVFALSDFLIGYGAWRAKTQPAWAEAMTIGLYLVAQAGLTAAVVKGEGQ